MISLQTCGTLMVMDCKFTLPEHWNCISCKFSHTRRYDLSWLYGWALLLVIKSSPFMLVWSGFLMIMLMKFSHMKRNTDFIQWYIQNLTKPTINECVPCMVCDSLNAFIVSCQGKPSRKLATLQQISSIRCQKYVVMVVHTANVYSICRRGNIEEM